MMLDGFQSKEAFFYLLQSKGAFLDLSVHELGFFGIYGCLCDGCCSFTPLSFKFHICSQYFKTISGRPQSLWCCFQIQYLYGSHVVTTTSFAQFLLWMLTTICYSSSILHFLCHLFLISKEKRIIHACYTYMLIIECMITLFNRC